MRKVCYPWILIRKSSIDSDSVNEFVEKYFSKGYLISVLLYFKCDKHPAELKNKSLKEFNNCFANYLGNNIEKN